MQLSYKGKICMKFKQYFKMEEYLCKLSINLVQQLCWFRTANHKPAVETRRWANIYYEFSKMGYVHIISGADPDGGDGCSLNSQISYSITYNQKIFLKTISKFHNETNKNNQSLKNKKGMKPKPHHFFIRQKSLKKLQSLTKVMRQCLITT